jgi:hypothetical protein
MTAQGIEQQNPKMDKNQEWGPEYCRAHRKMIIHVARGGVLLGPELVTCLNSRSGKKSVGVAPIFFKAQVMLNQDGPRISIITHSVAVNRGIDNRQS